MAKAKSDKELTRLRHELDKERQRHNETQKQLHTKINQLDAVEQRARASDERALSAEAEIAAVQYQLEDFKSLSCTAKEQLFEDIKTVCEGKEALQKELEESRHHNQLLLTEKETTRKSRDRRYNEIKDELDKSKKEYDKLARGNTDLEQESQRLKSDLAELRNSDANPEFSETQFTETNHNSGEVRSFNIETLLDMFNQKARRNEELGMENDDLRERSMEEKRSYDRMQAEADEVIRHLQEKAEEYVLACFVTTSDQLTLGHSSDKKTQELVHDYNMLVRKYNALNEGLTEVEEDLRAANALNRAMSTRYERLRQSAQAAIRAQYDHPDLLDRGFPSSELSRSVLHRTNRGLHKQCDSSEQKSCTEHHRLRRDRLRLDHLSLCDPH